MSVCAGVVCNGITCMSLKARIEKKSTAETIKKTDSVKKKNNKSMKTYAVYYILRHRISDFASNCLHSLQIQPSQTCKCVSCGRRVYTVMRYILTAFRHVGNAT